jgi:tetratricopeptide (TPR) repeat protein
MRRLAGALLVVLVLSFGARARAQVETASEAANATDRARLHFKLGVDFYRERNFRAALIEFKRAYGAAPHYKLLYNLGQASLELQEDAAAIEYFNEYLRLGADELSEDRRQEVEETIHRLEGRIATVAITSNEEGAEIYVDDTLIGRTPLEQPVRVSVGRRKLSAVKEGFPTAERIQDIAAGDHLSIKLEFPTKEAVVLDAYRAQPYPSSERVASIPAATWTGIATAALGASAVTMTILTALAQKAYDDEKQVETTRATLDRLRDDAKTKALITDIAWSATLVSGVITTVLIITNRKSAQDPDETAGGSGVRLAIGPSSLVVQGRL